MNKLQKAIAIALAATSLTAQASELDFEVIGVDAGISMIDIRQVDIRDPLEPLTGDEVELTERECATEAYGERSILDNILHTRDKIIVENYNQCIVDRINDIYSRDMLMFYPVTGVLVTYMDDSPLFDYMSIQMTKSQRPELVDLEKQMLECRDAYLIKGFPIYSQPKPDFQATQNFNSCLVSPWIAGDK